MENPPFSMYFHAFFYDRGYTRLSKALTITSTPILDGLRDILIHYCYGYYGSLLDRNSIWYYITYKVISCNIM